MSIRSKVIRELQARPCRMRELKDKLGNNKKVQAVVEELEADREVVCRGGVYFMARETRQRLEGVPCQVVKVAARFGFAQREDGEGDVFVPGRYLMGAMPGDRVLVRLFDEPRVPGSMEGEVTAVLEETNEFVGVLVATEEGYYAVAPDRCPDVPLYLKRNANGGAKLGEKVAVAIVERGTHHDDHVAAVTVRFGDAESARQCAKAILYDHDVVPEFPAAVKGEARAVSEKLEEKEIARRRDLREEAVFTIDAASTKDIDDAISLRCTEEGFELGVHIADVSYYVRPGTALDKEAFRRGTSVYYADSVVPMLPRQLSNGACSLNEGVDRYAFSCLMKLDRQGILQDYEFFKSVIHSRVKGVYSEINTLLAGQGDEALQEKYRLVASQFEGMRRLYERRLALRRERGGMELETSESKLIIDENGVCVDIQKRTRGLSECMIEEFMLLANECAANLARREKLPFVYRVHEEPDPEKTERLKEMLSACGLAVNFKKAIPTQTELEALLAQSRGTDLEKVVGVAVLRSMQKARYEAEPKGHFGLALADYAHFTSPIRRYPDLSIHRIMGAYLEGVTPGELNRRFGSFAADSSRQSSERELNAMQVERSAEDCYRAEYLKGHLGEQFEGSVSGVTAKGLFVELENTAEGFLPAAELCVGEPVFTEGVRLTDPVSKKSWMLGDRVMVKVARADVAGGKVDFVPAEAEEKPVKKHLSDKDKIRLMMS